MAVGDPWMRPGPSPFLEDELEYMAAQGISEVDDDVPIIMWQQHHQEGCGCMHPQCQETRNGAPHAAD